MAWSSSQTDNILRPPHPSFSLSNLLPSFTPLPLPSFPLGNPVAPITDGFLPPAFAAVPGMAAVFTQARSSKLWIPHPHDMCITGHGGHGFLGEHIAVIPAGGKKTTTLWGNGPDQGRWTSMWGSLTDSQNAFTKLNDM